MGVAWLSAGHSTAIAANTAFLMIAPANDPSRRSIHAPPIGEWCEQTIIFHSRVENVSTVGLFCNSRVHGLGGRSGSYVSSDCLQRATDLCGSLRRRASLQSPVPRTLIRLYQVRRPCPPNWCL